MSTEECLLYSGGRRGGGGRERERERERRGRAGEQLVRYKVNDITFTVSCISF